MAGQEPERAAAERAQAALVTGDLQAALTDERARNRRLVSELAERDHLLARVTAIATELGTALADVSGRVDAEQAERQRTGQTAERVPASPPRAPGGSRGGSLDELIERFEAVRDRLAEHGVPPRPARDAAPDEPPAPA